MYSVDVQQLSRARIAFRRGDGRRSYKQQHDRTENRREEGDDHVRERMIAKHQLLRAEDEHREQPY